MKKFGFLVLFSVLLLAACDKDDNKPVEKPVEKPDENPAAGITKEFKFLNASSYTDWVYFSFSKGEIVKGVNNDNYKEDLSWDIAFHRGDVRLNGGASGKGQGEAINTQVKDFDAVKEAPKSGYEKDKIGKITTAFTGTGIEEADEPFSQVITGWLNVDTSNPPPKYTIHNWVYVLKTANGEYVKLQIFDNKDEKDARAGFVSFRYQYADSNGLFK